MPRTRTRPTPRFQIAVHQEVERARQRIRKLDLWSALLVVAVTILGYGLAVVTLDAVFRFSMTARILLFSGLMLGLATYVFWAVVWPLYRTINPRYAARAIEQVAPGSKNALVNWLDLENEPLPAVIRNKVSERAAIVIEQAAVERAIPARKTARLAFAAGGLLLAMFFAAFLFAGQLGSLLKRAFVPFVHTNVPTKTRVAVTMTTFSGGVTAKLVDADLEDDGSLAEEREVAVLPDLPISVHVTIAGVRPDKVLLSLQDSLDEAPRFREFRPIRDDSRDEWEVRIDHDQIKAEGLWVRVHANDGSSRRYHLVHAARPDPRISGVEVLISAPVYTGRADRVQYHGPVEAMVGSKLTMFVTADQPIKSGTMEVNLAGQPRPTTVPLRADPAAAEHERDLKMVAAAPLHVSSEFQAKATYRFTLITPEGRRCVSPEYPITIEEDEPPKVELVQIDKKQLGEKDEVIPLPANAVVPVYGRAWDAIAVASCRLDLRTPDDRPLRLLGGKPADGSAASPLQVALGRPQSDWVKYHLILDLARLSADIDGPDPKPLSLRPGEKLLLRVVAFDNCQPEPKLGRSRTIQIEVTEPVSPEQRKNQEQQAQNPPPDQNPPENPEENPDKEGAGRNEGQPKDQEKSDAQGKDCDCKESDKDGQGKGQGEKADSDRQPGAGKNEGESQDRSGSAGKGAGASPPPQPPDNQPGQGKDAGRKSGQPENQPAQSKDPGKDEMNQPLDPKGEARGQGDQGMPENQPAQAKDAGGTDPNNSRQPAGQAKQPQPQDRPAAARDKGETQPPENPASESKGLGRQEPNEQDHKPAQAKDSGSNESGAPENQPAQAKDSGKPEGMKEQPAGQAREGGQNDPNNQNDPAGTAKVEPKKDEPAAAKGAGEKDPMQPEDANAQGREAGKQTADPNEKNAQSKGAGNEDPNSEKQPAGQARSDKPVNPENLPAAHARGRGKEDGNKDNTPSQPKEMGKTDQPPAQTKDAGKDKQTAQGEPRDMGQPPEKGLGKGDPEHKAKAMTPEERLRAEDLMKQGENLADKLKELLPEKPPTPDPTDPRAKERVTDLVLRNLHDLEKEGKLDREALKERLKELGFTEDQFKQFLEEYDQLQKDNIVQYLRNQAAARHLGSGPVKNVGGGSGGAGTIADPIKPPKELNSAENEFRKLIGPKP